MQIRSDHHFEFPVDRAALWRAVAATDDYQSWWPWLRRFEARGLYAGDQWTCVVRPPLPYAVHFTITLDEVEAPSRVHSIIAGDIVGAATLTLSDGPGCCELHLVSELAPANRFLQMTASVARPLAQFGHDWVITTGAHQFAANAL